MRVAVVGGGVVGLSVAWRLATAEHRVDLFDDDPGAGASYAAAGMLAPAGEAWFGEDALVRLGAASLALWPGFAADLTAASGVDVWLRRAGSLLVGADEADAADLDRLQGLLGSHGLAAERLTRRETRRLEPALAAGLRRCLRVPGDLSVHNRRVLRALLGACERTGVRVHHERADVLVGAPAAGVPPAGERADATGVRTRRTGATHAADAVVVAAGHALGDVAGVPEALRSAVRPVKGQILRLRASAPLVEHTVRARVRGQPVYAVPRADGEVVLGATSEERADTAVTADGMFEVLRRGIAVLPGLRECELAEATARVRPGTADNGPLIGRTSVPGLLVAAGHHRGGVLLAPATARAVAALLRGDRVDDTVRPFSPDRLSPEEATA